MQSLSFKKVLLLDLVRSLAGLLAILAFFSLYRFLALTCLGSSLDSVFKSNYSALILNFAWAIFFAGGLAVLFYTDRFVSKLVGDVVRYERA